MAQNPNEHIEKAGPAVAPSAADSPPGSPEAAFGVAHAIGVSTTKDEFGPLGETPGPDSHVVEEGVEPDYSPGSGLFLGFLVLTVALLATGYAVGNVFLAATRNVQQERELSSVDPRLSEVRELAAAYLNEYAVVEGSGAAPDAYRIPVTEAMNLIEQNPALLGGHPMGTPTRGIDAPGRISNGAAIGQDWATVVLEDPVVIPPPVVLEGSGLEGSAAEGSGAADVPDQAAALDPAGAVVNPSEPTGAEGSAP